MSFLSSLVNYQTVLKNMRMFLSVFQEDAVVKKTGALKVDFFNTFYAAAELPIKISTEEVLCQFEIDEDFDVFLSLFSEARQLEVREAYFPDVWDDSKKASYLAELNQTIEKLYKLSPELFSALFMLLYKIYLFPSHKIYSRSYVKTWGLIFISPLVDKVEKIPISTQFFEGLVHEALHQYLYLESVVNALFDMTEEETQQPIFKGALTLRDRPREVSFHSLVITNMLIQLHIKDDNIVRAQQLLPAYQTALTHFDNMVQDFRNANKPLLTENGQAWLTMLQETPWPAELVA